MADNKDIEKKIKDSVESLNVSAPANLWEKFSDKLGDSDADERIDNKIKACSDNLTKQAPSKVWGGVNRQLNIDLVWKRICKELDKKPIYNWKKLASVAALLLLLLSWGSYFFLSKRVESPGDSVGNIVLLNKKNKPIYSSEKIRKKENKNAQFLRNDDNKSVAENETLKDNNGKKAGFDYIEKNIDISKDKNSDSKNNAIESYAANETIVASVYHDSVLNMATLKPEFISILYDKEPIALSNIEKNMEDTVKDERKKISVGVTYAYNNTWVINEDTKNSFKETSLTSTSKSFASGYGLVANYYLNNNNALSTELLLNSKQQQYYGIYDKGKYYNKKIELNYSKITLAYQLNTYHRIGIVSSHYTLKAGMYLGILRNHANYYNNNVVSNNDSYKKFDYGVKVGFGQEQEWRNIVVGYGFNSEYGFINIFKGNNRIPADFNRTNPFNIGAYINVMYKF